MDTRDRPCKKTAILAALLLTCAQIHGTEIPEASVRPRAIGVLLLPPLDATSESANMQAPRQAVIRHRQQFEFITREFKVQGETLAARAAEISPVIDLSRLSARTTENLDQLARRTGADWVVHTVVLKVEGDAGEDGAFTVHTQLLLQVWDARRHDWRFNGPYVGQATGEGSPIMVFMHSLDQAAQGMLAKVLGDYPPVVPLASENSLIDYLADQKTPAIDVREKPSAGLHRSE